MPAWERLPMREERYQQRRKTPSFSSSLLDAISRSIDEEHGNDRKQTVTHALHQELVDEDIAKWIYMKSNSTPSTRSSRRFNSKSSSSDSSCGGMFSSSETESASRSTARPSIFTEQRSKQGLTVVTEKFDRTMQFEAIPKREGRFTRTKSTALKIYGDLKKAKQPISPGGRIASFLNSIFNSRNVKKSKLDEDAMEDWSPVRKSRSGKDSTTCSSASSFSRSCLSKTPSSRGKSKRSVRFCPVSVIVDEDCRPCGHKTIYQDDPDVMPAPIVRKLAETAMLNNEFTRRFTGTRNSARVDPKAYCGKNMKSYDFRDFHDDGDDDDGDDGESCCSSDLFELENIGSLGIGAYREELPVYGTTSLKANHAIAKGLIL